MVSEQLDQPREPERRADRHRLVGHEARDRCERCEQIVAGPVQDARFVRAPELAVESHQLSVKRIEGPEAEVPVTA